MNITAAQIKAACPNAKNLAELVPQINNYCEQYGINTRERIAMFLGQCLHETAGFRYMEELWGPTKWQVKYEGHKGLGNTQKGDGKRFMGRGLIQLTGRSNYYAFSKWANAPEIMDAPSLVASPKFAVLSAIYYWVTNGLNKYADVKDCDGCTRRINGKGMLGKDERRMYFDKLCTVMAGDNLPTNNLA